MMLISVITMPAMASPRTNLLAPSMAPKKSACCVSIAAAALGLALVDHAGVQVGVDRHLPPGHAVQGEAGRDFADSRGALGDHDELDDDDDGEDDQADHDHLSPATNSPKLCTTPPAASM